MAFRDLTPHFFQLRKYFNRQENQYEDDEFEPEEFAGFNNPYNQREPAVAKLLARQSEWIQNVHIAREDLLKLKKKISRLIDLHKQHLTPRFGKDTLTEEQQIEGLTDSIKQLFSDCKTTIEALDNGKEPRNEEELMQRNSKIAMVTELTDLSKQFRNEQREYLAQLKSLKERRKELTVLDDAIDLNADEQAQVAEIEQRMSYDPSVDADHIRDLMANQEDIIRRDREIREILRSIFELQDLFKEFSDLVIEQGSLIDRIDYNIETTLHFVEEGNENLRVVVEDNSESKSTTCVIILAVVFICLLLILVARIMIRLR